MSSTPHAFRGAYTALVTPLRDDRVDEKAFTRLLEDQIAAGIAGVIPRPASRPRWTWPSTCA